MTQEEKELLLKDLCARLPYGVMLDVPIVSGSETKKLVSVIQEDTGMSYVTTYSNEERGSDGNLISYKQDVFGVCDVIPYLRSMSSMTKEEKENLKDICTMYDCDMGSDYECFGIKIFNISRYGTAFESDYMAIDWFNKKMFDYRGLIPNGLALEAPEGMY